MGTQVYFGYPVLILLDQGSVLSLHLFTVYLDGLLADLCNPGVGCYWDCTFVGGGYSYADDVVLLAPCASAMRKMLQICFSFSPSHELKFNANKT